MFALSQVPLWVIDCTLHMLRNRKGEVCLAQTGHSRETSQHVLLRRAALCQYDLGLAYMVIAASQRDPGEYMMQLRRFAETGAPQLQRHAVRFLQEQDPVCSNASG